MFKAAFRSLLPAAVLVGIAAAIVPQPGHAAPATETRSVPEFTAIAANGSVNISVTQGPVTSVQVTADDKELPNIETVVESGKHGPTLQIRMKREGWSWRWSWGWGWGKSYHSGPINVVIVTPRLTGLASAGSGDIRVGALQTPSLQLSIAGSGNTRLVGLSTDELSVNIAGSGDVSAEGRSGKLNVSIAGSGDGRLGDLRSDDVVVKIAGSGGAVVQAQKTLSVSIAGSGDVVYSGEATVKSSVAGSGSVKKR